MTPIPLYPLRFSPILEYRIWGGQHLSNLLDTPLGSDDCIGEAWMLSDRDDHASIINNGLLKGQSLGELFKQSQQQLMGKLAGHFDKFPLLLKFLDANDMLSVQVHPSDEQKDYIPAGEQGKTEAWVVLEAGTESRIYAGLKQKTTADNLRQSIKNGTIQNYLSSFTPKSGDGVFLPAGTIHSLGGNLVVFEVQQNSDVTFRLFDWNHIDPTTAQPRALQIEQAIACIDFEQGEQKPVVPLLEECNPILRERLFQCDHFRLWRLSGSLPFTIGVVDMPRILVCIEGGGKLDHNGDFYSIRKGDVWLLPAVVGSSLFRPDDNVCLLEIALPE
jgi:mannose-6-phosphate isomerase